MPDHNKAHGFSATPTRIVIFIFIALTLIALMGLAISKKTDQNRQNKQAQQQPREIVTISPHTIVYGTWTANSSAIIAYDLSTGWEGVIANLPVNIKKVTVSSPTTIIYINKTDNRDHGKEIVQYNLLTQQRNVIYKATDSFGIDDYVVSPDFKRIAVWEVQVNEQSGTLLNGRSRVYSTIVGETGKNIIYDETVILANPIRYPLAILNDGTIFSDKFLPNDGAGWAYGMSVSNFIGTEKSDISSMQNGTYGTKPVLSPDGKYLAFSGYDGGRGMGTAEIDGFRRALLNSNTVELLDVDTLERKKLPNLSSSNFYSAVSWNSDSENLLVSSNNRDPNQTGTFNYNLATNTLQLNSPDISPVQEYIILQQLSPELWLVGTKNPSSTALGNLGDVYDSPFSSLSVYNTQTKEVTLLETASELIQYISVLPATSFGSFQLLLEETPPSQEVIPLKTFNVKSDLATIREKQQTNRNTLSVNPETGETTMLEDNNLPRCEEFSIAQITQICGNTPNTQVGSTQVSYQKCSENIIKTNRSSSICY